MWNSIRNIYFLGMKELMSLRSDLVMCVLIVLSFTVFIYIPSQNAALDTRNASIAIVDQDHTPLSRTVFAAFQEPYFKLPVLLDAGDIDRVMAAGDYTFVVWIPERFQADMLDNRQPSIQLLVDATAMSQAGNGAAYITEVIGKTLQTASDTTAVMPININMRVAYNPNLYSSWFFAINNLINMISMLAIVLTGAALIRERERGTVEHLLVMPLRPIEIAIGKVWANSAVILVAVLMCIFIVIRGVLHVPVAGSLTLFMFGSALYLFAVSSIGIFLGTVARSMPQLGLLFLPIVLLISVLSGGLTPMEAMPAGIQYVMTVMPSSHFTQFAMAVLFRGAGLNLVWQPVVSMCLIGVVFLTLSLLRFRKSIAAGNG